MPSGVRIPPPAPARKATLSVAGGPQILGRDSSTVEHAFCKREVVGSNPTPGSTSLRSAQACSEQSEEV